MQPGPFKTIEEIAQANQRAGQKWFSEGANDFFRTAYVSGVVAGRYFITREQCIIGNRVYPAAFTIRKAEDDGRINTIGSFNEMLTQEVAEKWLDRLVKDEITEQDIP